MAAASPRQVQFVVAQLTAECRPVASAGGNSFSWAAGCSPRPESEAAGGENRGSGPTCGQPSSAGPRRPGPRRRSRAPGRRSGPTNASSAAARVCASTMADAPRPQAPSPGARAAVSARSPASTVSPQHPPPGWPGPLPVGVVGRGPPRRVALSSMRSSCTRPWVWSSSTLSAAASGPSTGSSVTSHPRPSWSSTTRIRALTARDGMAAAVPGAGVKRLNDGASGVAPNQSKYATRRRVEPSLVPVRHGPAVCSVWRRKSSWGPGG